MNPAPTMLNDWVTNRGFWISMGFLAFVALVWWVTEVMKRWHAASVELDRVLKEGPPNNCGILGCDRTGLIRFNLPDGVLFVCQQHSWTVSQWVGRSTKVYDQELDPATDFSLWNQEM
jgi:hypothetical protein